jgi:hypothetical protein
MTTHFIIVSTLTYFYIHFFIVKKKIHARQNQNENPSNISLNISQVLSLKIHLYNQISKQSF